MMRLALTTLLLFAAASAQSRDEAAIRQILADQTAAWNRGDLESFMRGYEDSADTAFVGAGGIRRGFRAVLERYRRDYPDRARMGETSFHDLDVRLVADDCATVIGRFQLARPEEFGGPLSGVFTLVLRKRAGDWRIVLDHTTRTQTR